MKQYGFVGKGTGKLGASVFAISGGEQIVRQYNPVVSNPNTEAQIAQRAKLKLMSQLAAALDAALGFAKKGLVSARNQFVSKNIGLCTFANEEASVTLEDLQLTPSSIEFPAVGASYGGGGELTVKLSAAAPSDVKRVVYAIFEKTANGQLLYVASKVISEAGSGRVFSTSFEVGNGEFIVYAYGVKDTTSAATIKYENYVAEVGDTDAVLSVIQLFRGNGYQLTATSADGVTVQ